MKALGTADQAPPGPLTHVPPPRREQDPSAALLPPPLPDLRELPLHAPEPPARTFRIPGAGAWTPRTNPGLYTGLAFGVLLPVLLSALSGNLGIPHNDAWSYSRIAETFGRTGHIWLLGWNRSALVGQIIVLGPLARSLVVQQLFVALTAGVVLVAAHVLLRPRLGVRRAGWAAAILALYPGFGLMGTSFMADLPALAAMLVCLVLGRRAARTGSVRLFAAAMAVGLWGTTIRQQAIAAPVAVGLCLLGDRRFRRGRRLAVLLGGGALFSAAFLVFYIWHDGLPKSDPPQYKLVADWVTQLHQLGIQSLFTLAVPLAPAVVYAARPRQWSWTAQWATLVTGWFALDARRSFGPENLFLQNYLSVRGPYNGVDWDTGRHRIILGPHAWGLVTLTACLSAALLVGLLVEHWRRTRCDRFLATFSLITAVGTAATNVVGQDVYDRYLLVLAPAVLAVVLAPRPDTVAGAEPVPSAFASRLPARLRVVLGRRPAAVLVGTGVAMLSLVMLTTSLAWDAARWHTAAKIAKITGLPAEKIDAGLEWDGWHSPEGVIERNPANPIWGWEDYLGTTPACRILTVYPDRDHPFALLGIYKFKTYMIGGTSRLYYYDTQQPGCPVPIPQP